MNLPMSLPTPDEIQEAVAAAAADPQHQEVSAALGGAAVVAATITATVATFGAASVALSTVRRAVEGALWVTPALTAKLMDLLDTIFDFLAGITANVVDAAAEAAGAAAHQLGETGQHVLKATGKTTSLAGRWIVSTTGVDRAAQRGLKLAGKAQGVAGGAANWIGSTASNTARQGQTMVREGLVEPAVNAAKPVLDIAIPAAKGALGFGSAVRRILALGPKAAQAIVDDPVGFASALAANAADGAGHAAAGAAKPVGKFGAAVIALAGEGQEVIAAISANPVGFAAAIAEALASGVIGATEDKRQAANERVGRMSAQIAKLTRNTIAKV